MKNWTLEENQQLKKLILSNKYSYQQIAQLLNRSKSSCLNQAPRIGIKSTYRNKKYSHNEDFWAIPIPVNAYWAGFAAADACISVKQGHHYRFRLDLQVKDKNHLEKFKEDTRFTGNIIYNKRISSHKAKRPFVEQQSYNLHVHGCHKWIQDLKNIWNIEQNKTYRIAPPINLDKYLQLCWLVGYIDGDGSINFNQYLTKEKHLQTFYGIELTSASIGLLEYAKNIIWEVVSDSNLKTSKEPKIRKKKNTNAFVYSVSGIKACVLFDYLSQIPIYKLARKWQDPKILELVAAQKQKHPHLFKTLEVPQNWQSFVSQSPVSQEIARQ